MANMANNEATVIKLITAEDVGDLEKAVKKAESAYDKVREQRIEHGLEVHKLLRYVNGDDHGSGYRPSLTERQEIGLKVAEMQTEGIALVSAEANAHEEWRASVRRLSVATAKAGRKVAANARTKGADVGAARKLLADAESATASADAAHLLALQELSDAEANAAAGEGASLKAAAERLRTAVDVERVRGLRLQRSRENEAAARLRLIEIENAGALAEFEDAFDQIGATGDAFTIAAQQARTALLAAIEPFHAALRRADVARSKLPAELRDARSTFCAHALCERYGQGWVPDVHDMAKHALERAAQQ